MKRLMLIGMLAGVAGVLCAQSQTGDITKKGFGEIGFSTLLLKPAGGSMISFVGVAIRGGGYMSAKSYIGAEIDACGLTNPQNVGTFSYTETIGGSSTTHTDGKIARNYSATPILVFWNYAPDFTPKLHFNVGPVLGMTVFHSKYSFTPSVNNEPKMPSATKVGFNYGAEIGLLYDFYNTVAVGLRYRFLGNSGANFDNKKLQGSIHQINAVLNITF